MASGTVFVEIRVRPRSSRAGLESGADGRFVARVHAPAVGGAANRECVELLAKTLGTAKSAVEIVRGEKGRLKRIAVAGMEAAEVRERLARATGKGARS
jgi:uncharacterized protein (TIGR00251 family)